MYLKNQKKYLIAALLFSILSVLNAQNEAQEAESLLKKTSEALSSKNFIDASQKLQKAKEAITLLLNNQLTSSLPEKFDNWIQISDSKASNSIGMQGSTEINAIKIYEQEQLAIAKKDIPVPPAIKMDTMAGIKAPSSNPIPVPTPGSIPQGNPPAMSSYAPPATPPSMNMGAMGMNNEKPRLIISISNNAMVASNIAFINSGSDSNQMTSSLVGEGGEEKKAIKIKNYRAMSKYNKMMRSGEVAVIVGAGVVQIQGNNIENTDLLQKFAEQVDYQKIKAVFGE